MLKATITCLPVRVPMRAHRGHHGADALGQRRVLGVGAALVVLDEVDAGRAQLRRPARRSRSALRPTLGLMIVPTSGPPAHAGRAARAGDAVARALEAARGRRRGSSSASSRRPVVSPRSYRLPATVAASVGRLAPMLASGKRHVDARAPPRARRCAGAAARRWAGSARPAARARRSRSTVARLRARSASVSPATRTKVPLLCSPASTSATRAGSSGVSIR